MFSFVKRLGPAMLNQPICCDIFADSPAEKADICSCIYMRKVSDDHLPCFRIVSRWMPLRCMAMAPPALKEWLLIDEGGKPFLSRPMATTAAFSMRLMSPAWRHRSHLVAAE